MELTLLPTNTNKVATQMNVGKSLKIALAMRGMKQTDLAKKLGVSKEYVNRVANAEHAGMGTVTKMADAMGMQVSEFLKLGEE